jgi:hypothetical protein
MVTSTRRHRRGTKTGHLRRATIGGANLVVDQLISQEYVALTNWIGTATLPQLSVLLSRVRARPAGGGVGRDRAVVAVRAM